MVNYQRVYGAFHKWRYPNSWMVYFNVKKSWNIHNWMIWGYPDLRKPWYMKIHKTVQPTPLSVASVMMRSCSNSYWVRDGLCHRGIFWSVLVPRSLTELHWSNPWRSSLCLPSPHLYPFLGGLDLWGFWKNNRTFGNGGAALSIMPASHHDKEHVPCFRTWFCFAQSAACGGTCGWRQGCTGGVPKFSDIVAFSCWNVMTCLAGCVQCTGTWGDTHRSDRRGDIASSAVAANQHYSCCLSYLYPWYLPVVVILLSLCEESPARPSHSSLTEDFWMWKLYLESIGIRFNKLQH